MPLSPVAAHTVGEPRSPSKQNPATPFGEDVDPTYVVEFFAILSEWRTRALTSDTLSDANTAVPA